MRILVVDDSMMLRKIIRKELEKGGYEIFEAADGIEALQTIEDVQPHLVTLDVDMPGMNGYEVAYKIRSEIKPLSTEVSQKVPIVFVTANDTLEGRTKGFQAGASDFITKPFVHGEVLNAVDAILKPDNSLKGLTALIAEDSMMARNVLNSILQSEGINTILTSTGAEAFEIVKNRGEEIDLLLTDLIMPEMTGDELCRKVRMELSNKTLPIIFLSAMSEHGSILEIFKAGASDYVIKPFAKEELLARIRVHLESRMLNQKLVEQVHDLKRLSKLQSDFLSVTSHDLRAPLNGVLGFTNLLLDDPELIGERREYLEHIKDSGNFLLTLINDILDLGKAQSEHDDHDFEQLPLLDVLTSSTNTVRHMATPKAIRLETKNYSDDSLYVLGSRNSLVRIFNNILSNAIKFTPRDGAVKQMIEKTDDDHVVVSIIDSGIGIPENMIASLFEKFTKTSREGTSGEKGTGLGLAITKELVDRHQGTIQVTSTVGKGTCFKLTFPLIPTPTEKGQMEEVEEEIEIEDGRTFHFLLVDDNHLNIKLASRVLTHQGHRVTSKMDGKSALVTYVDSLKQEEKVYDMIFMDLSMPVMNGYESAEMIRKYEKRADIEPIPIIAMTAGNGEKEREKCKQVGMTDFVTKPMNIRELKNVIRHHLIDKEA